MEVPDSELAEVTEGRTRLLVPRASVTERVPPRGPAFFNPRARRNRDMSMVAYAAFLGDFGGPGILLDAMAGVGARGLRAAVELDVESVVINDLNPTALRLAGRSAALNGAAAGISREEACRFLASRSARGSRGAVVDIDPFGSPAPLLDCGLRAVMHGGMLSVTATDLQVLGGLEDAACRRIYGGVPVRTWYGRETAVRLVLGCLRGVAARLGMTVRPLFVECDMHYYRAYVRVGNRPDRGQDTGYIVHCHGCGHRAASQGLQKECALCGGPAEAAGPLWTGAIHDAGFVGRMIAAEPGLEVHGSCRGTLERCLAEAGLPAAYYTVDEMAARTGSSPPSPAAIIAALAECGYAAGPTAFDPTGFKTDAGVPEIAGVMESIR